MKASEGTSKLTSGARPGAAGRGRFRRAALPVRSARSADTGITVSVFPHVHCAGDSRKGEYLFETFLVLYFIIRNYIYFF